VDTDVSEKAFASIIMVKPVRLCRQVAGKMVTEIQAVRKRNWD
jgi:hypothetical protein